MTGEDLGIRILRELGIDPKTKPYVLEVTIDPLSRGSRINVNVKFDAHEAFERMLAAGIYGPGDECDPED